MTRSIAASWYSLKPPRRSSKSPPPGRRHQRDGAQQRASKGTNTRLARQKIETKISPALTGLPTLGSAITEARPRSVGRKRHSLGNAIQVTARADREPHCRPEKRTN